MKNVKLMLLAVSAMLFLGMGNVSAQNNNSLTVIIKVYEAPFLSFKSQMIVTEPSGTSRTVELKNLSSRSSVAEAASANSASLQTEIHNWKNEGYEINGVSGSSIGDISVTTIILSKKE